MDDSAAGMESGAPMVRKIPLADRDGWRGALEGIPHGFGHTWESCAAVELTTGLPTFLYADETPGHRVVSPICERSFQGHLDVVTPYGLSGLAGAALQAGAGYDRWMAFARQQGYVCGYITVHPLFAPAECASLPEYAAHNDLYVLDLRAPQQALLDAMSQNPRRVLKAFERSDASLVDDRQALLAFLMENADEFMESKNFSGQSRLNARSLEALGHADNTLAIGVRIDGDIVAAALYGYSDFCADMSLVVIPPAGRGTMTALIWGGIQRLKGLGVALLNLGGGIRRDDGVAQFKERFGPRKCPLGALKQVYRPDIFNRLCEAHVAAPTAFFPPYRA